jgi:hypothetical protein
MKERGGRAKAFPIPELTKQALYLVDVRNIEKSSVLNTDEYVGYKGIDRLSYEHKTINHKAREYSRKGISTNGIESLFAVLKRGLHGVYRHASKKHIGRYVDEFTFRLNDGNVRRHTWDRLDSFVDAVSGKRITYKVLTA